jgi:hypothetical protein
VKVTPHDARTVSVRVLGTSAEPKRSVYLTSLLKLVRCRWSVRLRTLDECKTALLSQCRFQSYERFGGNVLSGLRLPPGSPVSARPLASLSVRHSGAPAACPARSSCRDERGRDPAGFLCREPVRQASGSRMPSASVRPKPSRRQRKSTKQKKGPAHRLTPFLLSTGLGDVLRITRLQW